MLQSDRDLARRTQLRVFKLCQLPFLILWVPVAAGAAVYGPPISQQPWLVAGSALAVGCSAIAWWAPWPRGWHELRVIVPALDIVAVAVMRVDVVDLLTSVSLMSVLPAMWLASEFGRRGIVVAISSALLVTGLPYLRDGVVPATGEEWMRFLLFPAAMVGVVFTTRVSAQLLAVNQQQVVDRTLDLAEALDASKDTLDVGQAILDTVDAAIWFYNVNGTMRLANPQAHDLAERGGFQLDAPPYVGDDVWRADRRTAVPGNDQIVARALRGEVVDGEFQWFGPLDDQRALVLSARHVHRDGNLLGTVIAGWDVTQLTEAVQAREEFLTTVSHELRTPLTSIIGYLEIVDDQLDPDATAIRRILAVVERNADTLLERISQLLNASETGIRFQLASIDVATAIMAALVKHAPSATKAGIELRTELHPAPWGHLDAHRFEQVVDNLVSNAIKYTPSGGVITVALSNDVDTFDLTVSDTGIGMSAEDQEHAFDRFYRSESARDSAIQGIGIGLGIVKTIVETHGGEIFLRSVAGSGTTVTVRIPISVAPSPDQSAA